MQRFTHLSPGAATLSATTLSARDAEKFDVNQCSEYCSLNSVKLTNAAAQQVLSLPLKTGGHGFPSLHPLIKRDKERGLGQFDPEKLCTS